jgi:hypothetical protein
MPSADNELWDRAHPRQSGDNAGSIARQTVCKWRSHRERNFFVLSSKTKARHRFWHDLRPTMATRWPHSITSPWPSAASTMRATPRRSASHWPSSPLRDAVSRTELTGNGGPDRHRIDVAPVVLRQVGAGRVLVVRQQRCQHGLVDLDPGIGQSPQVEQMVMRVDDVTRAGYFNVQPGRPKSYVARGATENRAPPLGRFARRRAV